MSAGRGILGSALSSLTARSTDYVCSVETTARHRLVAFSARAGCTIESAYTSEALRCSANEEAYPVGASIVTALSSNIARSTGEAYTLKLTTTILCDCKSAGWGILGCAWAFLTARSTEKVAACTVEQAYTAEACRVSAGRGILGSTLSSLTARSTDRAKTM